MPSLFDSGGRVAIGEQSLQVAFRSICSASFSCLIAKDCWTLSPLHMLQLQMTNAVLDLVILIWGCELVVVCIYTPLADLGILLSFPYSPNWE
jgi:hypothetical protein